VANVLLLHLPLEEVVHLVSGQESGLTEDQDKRPQENQTTPGNSRKGGEEWSADADAYSSASPMATYQANRPALMPVYEPLRQGGNGLSPGGDCVRGGACFFHLECAEMRKFAVAFLHESINNLAEDLVQHLLLVRLAMPIS
jgi:hypothetical protein